MWAICCGNDLPTLESSHRGLSKERTAALRVSLLKVWGDQRPSSRTIGISLHLFHSSVYLIHCGAVPLITTKDTFLFICFTVVTHYPHKKSALLFSTRHLFFQCCCIHECVNFMMLIFHFFFLLTPSTLFSSYKCIFSFFSGSWFFIHLTSSFHLLLEPPTTPFPLREEWQMVNIHSWV